MSRHRYVKNLNIDDELDDDALSDGGEEEMTQEQHMQMIDALERVREVIGEEDISGIPDSEVRDAIWYYNFDVENTVSWCIQEQEKRRAARERQGVNPYSNEYGSERSRIPLIYLAQQRMAEQGQHQGWEEQEYDDLPEHEVEQEEPVVPVLQSKRSLLSTITEKTERTEPSPYLMHRIPSVTSGTSYGDIIENGRFDHISRSPIDPNTIPLSPSESAVNRLSMYEPAPSWATTSSTGSNVSSPPRPPSEPVPPIETIPEIPDSTSRSVSTHPTPQKSAKQPSKLAQLASSRASSRTKSAILTSSSSESVKTYPKLRPAATDQSSQMRPQSSSTISRSQSQSNRSQSHSASTVQQSMSPSSTSFHIDKAIQIAMDMEAKDRDKAAIVHKPLPKTPSVVSSASASTARQTPRPSAPTPSKVLEQPSATESPAIKGKNTGAVTRAPTKSKLALLAQERELQKALRAPVAKPSSPELPPEKTEYLTPIANGPSVTTAITTSYQTLYSLTDPSKPPTSKAPHVVPLPAVDYVTGSEKGSNTGKPSKLAMKIKKAHEKHEKRPEPEPEPYTIPPMFLPRSKSTRSSHRASPSAFASVLVDDESSKGGEAENSRRRRKSSTTITTSSFSSITSSSTATSTITSTSDSESRSRSTRSRKPIPMPGPSTSGFAFDSPSPDDIVFNARKGTALGKMRA
ncbi:hypothetical protein Moror_1412 [Moniliophthora roreri MCA 2997]|uniref:HBS1-like protein N-terminal domain-containing protein n=1 Tax=Moniliophthora roreri (strain MCA 2997) TaxID=1381753 RepID=V2YPV0_MONRO|nr:hypothetical protein Moror_1412 [Moniliophthora roreri MCA 2997]